MTQQIINLGAAGSGAGGDSARTAFEKAIANFAELYQQVAGMAPLASPPLTGNPTAPTPPPTDNDTSIATTAFVRAAMGLFGLGTDAVPARNDLNTLTTAGIYQFNIPTSGSPGFNYGAVLVLARATNEVVQIAWDIVTETQVSRKLIGGTWSPWRAAYHAGNILGTVSQSGGAPTGAIIERGSNANGEYVRFADGTQICTVYKVKAAAAGILANGVYYWSEPWAFPAAFISAPSLTIGAFVAGVLSWGSADGQTGDSTIGYLNAFANIAATADVHYRAIAIGRWY